MSAMFWPQYYVQFAHKAYSYSVWQFEQML